MKKKDLAIERKLPIWTWVAPLFIAHAATHLSLFFKISPGLSFLYFPVILGFCLIQWWGPRVLAGIYINGIISCFFFNLPGWYYWPLYALPETIELFLSWLLFKKLLNGKAWLPDFNSVVRFLIPGLLIPVLTGRFLSQSIFLITGIIKLENFYAAFSNGWIGDICGSFAFTIPLLVLDTRFLEKYGLSISTDAMLQFKQTDPYNSLRRVELVTIGALVVFLSLFLRDTIFQPAYALFAFWVIMRFSFIEIIFLNALFALFLVIIPAITHLPDMSFTGILTQRVHSMIDIILLMAGSLAAARIMRDYKDALYQRTIEEQALRESLQASADIADAIPSGLFIYQYEPPDRLILITGNRAAEQLTGIVISKWKGKEFDLIWPGARKSGVTQAYLNVMTTGKIFEAEDLYYKDDRLDGAFRIKAFRMPSNRLGVAFENITNFKQAETALKQSEERLSFALEAVNDAIWEMRNPGSLFYWSPRYFTMLGYKNLELTPGLETWKNLIHPDDQQQAIDMFIQCRDNKQDVYEAEVRLKTSTGSWKWILIRGRVIKRDNEGGILHMTGTHTDITERKQNEDQIKSSLKEKETLLRELYHRTKNNMQVISSMLSLQKSNLLDEKAVKIIEDTENRIRAMALVHQKLYQSPSLTSINLREYFTDLSMLLIKSCRIDLQRVALNFAVDDAWAAIDTAIPCGMVVNELLSNAFKYAFPNKKNGTILLVLKQDNEGTVELRIEDNGIGLPDNIDFRNTSTLGMQIVVNIVEHQLHGTIAIENNNGVKCTIRFKNAFLKEKE